MPSNSIPRLAVSVLILSLGGIQAIAATPTTQFGRVEVSESPDQTGPLVLSSASDGELELVVGSAPDAGAELFVDPISIPSEQLIGTRGTAVATADNRPITSVGGVASAKYEYGFMLTSNAEISFVDFFVNAQGPEAAASFLLERDGDTTLFFDEQTDSTRIRSLSGEILLPGEYLLTISAFAEAEPGPPLAQRFVQADFFFAFTTVPEPGVLHLAIAGATTIALVPQRRIRRSRSSVG